MLDAVLERFTVKIRITIKSAVSLLCIILAVALPQLAHIAVGAPAGITWLPMFLPVLLSGCLLGYAWGLGVGILSPVFSYGFTTLALGNAMPALGRLPFMALELAVFGLVSGLFAKKITQNSLYAFPAVIVAQLCGRTVNVISGLIAGQNITAIWNVIQAGLIGLYAQAIIVPVIVIILAKVIKNDDAQ